MAILTISREYGAGGRDVGQLVATRLDYRYIDKERLFLDLEKHGQRWARVARELDEVCPTLWERFDWQYRGYVALVEALILDYAVQDRVVILGRGGAYLLREVPFCLKVRLVAPWEIRLERIMIRESLDRDAAALLIKKVDQERACYLQANYGRDGRDQTDYDLVLNTGDLSYEEAAAIITKALLDKEALATPAAKEALANLALAHRLKARLAMEPRLFIPTLEVRVENQEIVISGIIHSPKELALLKNLARQVAGDRPLRFDLHYRL